MVGIKDKSGNEKYYCDLCKKEIDINKEWAMIERHKVIKKKEDSEQGYYISVEDELNDTCDYHLECYEKIKGVIDLALHSQASYNILITNDSIKTYSIGEFHPLIKADVIDSLENLKKALWKEIEEWKPDIDINIDIPEEIQKEIEENKGKK